MTRVVLVLVLVLSLPLSLPAATEGERRCQRGAGRQNPHRSICFQHPVHSLSVSHQITTALHDFIVGNIVTSDAHPLTILSYLGPRVRRIGLQFVFVGARIGTAYTCLGVPCGWESGFHTKVTKRLSSRRKPRLRAEKLKPSLLTRRAARNRSTL